MEATEHVMQLHHGIVNQYQIVCQFLDGSCLTHIVPLIIFLKILLRQNVDSFAALSHLTFRLSQSTLVNHFVFSKSVCEIFYHYPSLCDVVHWLASVKIKVSSQSTSAPGDFTVNKKYKSHMKKRRKSIL